MVAAIQQVNVRLQQPGTTATILQAERDDLARQVQSATSTTTQRQPGDVDTRVIGRPDKFEGDPMEYADRSFRLRSYLGAVDQWYQLEPTTTEASSTPRLDANLGSEASCLSTQMYYTLEMTTTGSASDKCHSAGMNEGFEARKQFVMEWEMQFVGLLMNVLPTKLAAFERLVHKSQSSETVGDDTKIGVTVLGMEDMRIKAHPIGNGARIANWTQTREDILEITRTQQYTDSKPVPLQNGAKTARIKAKAWQGCKGMSRPRNRKGMIRKDATAVRRQGMYGLKADRN